MELQQARDLVRDAIDRAIPRHKRWRALEALYRTGSLKVARSVMEGTLWDDVDLDEEVVNLTLPHVNLIISTAIAQDPKLLAVPIGGDPAIEEYAATAEGVINFYWKRARVTRALRQATQDAVIIGNGILKTGWTHVGEDDELDDDEFLAELAELAEDDRIQAEALGEEPRSIEELSRSIDTSVERVEADEPYVEYVSPYDVFVPPNATEMADVAWVVHRITEPIEDVAERFGVDVEDIHSDTNINDDGNDTPSEWRRRQQQESPDGSRTVGEVFETATYFEFWDVANERLLCFQLDGGEDEVLFDSDDDDSEYPHGHRRVPFVHLRGYRQTGTDFWGFGDVENIANLQQMLNELFTMQLDNARRSGNKVFMDDEFVTDEVRDAFESDKPDAIVPVKVKSKTLSEIVEVVRKHELSSDVYVVKQDIEEYLQRVLGINDFQAGGVGADRMSATAAAVVDSVASLRAADKVMAVEECASEVGQHILLLCQEFLEEPRAVRVAGTVSPMWLPVDKSVLRGEFLVEVEAGSTRQETPQTRENRGVTLLQQVAPALVELGMDPTPAIRQAIRALGFDPDVLMQPMEQPALPPGQEGAPQQGAPEVPEELMDLIGGVDENAPAMGPFMRGGPPTALAAQAAGTQLV